MINKYFLQQNAQADLDSKTPNLIFEEKNQKDRHLILDRLSNFTNSFV